MRLRDIVGDIIEISGLDEGHKGESERIDVKETVDSEIKKLEHKAEENGVTVINDVHSSLHIYGWPNIFSDIVSNLLDNAIRYNKRGGFVKVQGKEEDGKLNIIISDNGIGIPEDSLERVFERFYRGDASRNTGKGGSGLGLAIVKQIVEDHGGTITARSKEGEGTTISFTLLKVRWDGGEQEIPQIHRELRGIKG